MESNILSVLTFLPLMGILAMFVAYMLKQDDYIYKYIALFTTFIQLVLTGWLYKNFEPNIILPADNAINPTKFVIQVPWIDNFNIQYFLPEKFFFISGIILLIFFSDTKKTKELSIFDSLFNSKDNSLSV